MTASKYDFDQSTSAFARCGAGAPMLLALLCVGLPLLLAPFDFWDGRILFHALETNQNIGVQHWFFTSGWIIQYYIFSAVQSIEGITGPTGLFLLRIIMITSLCGIVYEALQFSKNIARLPHSWALAAAAIVAVFPAWNALLSSVTFIYVLCTWLILLSVRLIHRAEAHSIFIGIILLLLSFQLNSNFVFSIALAIAYLASTAVHHGSIKRGDSYRFVAIILTSILAYIALKLSFTPSDLYAKYNDFKPINAVSDLLTFVIGMIRYYQYAIVLAMILACAHLSLAILTKRAITSTQDDYKKLLWPIALSLFLIGCAAFPYVVVGKSADIRAVMVDWNPRHTFLMALPVGLFMASLAQLLCRWHNLGNAKLRYLPAICAVLFMAIYLQAAFWHKTSRAAYEAGIITALKQQTPPPTGFVKFVAADLPIALMRYYETNWLLYKAYGAEKWFSGMVASADQAMFIPDWLDSEQLFSEENKIKHIMTNFRPECETILQVEGKQFTFSEVMSWAIANQPLPETLTVSLINSTCQP